MAAERLQPAYVLHGRDFRETSRVLELLTPEQGRIGVVARGARRPRSPWRALLMPFRPLLVAAGGRGELLTLHRAEPAGRPPQLAGEGLLAGLYANELLLRLTARHDPHPGLFAAYHALLPALSDRARRGWALRRFELRLLTELGWAPVLERTVDGEPVIAGRRYRLDPERGPRPLAAGEAGGVDGATLLALASGARLEGGRLTEARRLLQGLIGRHLGGRALRTRELVASGAATEERA